MALNSAFQSRRRISPEYQPETSARLCFFRIGLSAATVRGNLRPSSVPEKPAARVWERQVSRGILPPSQCMQSFVQPIGLMPSLTAIFEFLCFDCLLRGDAAQPRQFRFEIDQLLAAGHEIEKFIARDGASWISARAASAFQDREAVADGIGMMDIVRDEDHADAARTR